MGERRLEDRRHGRVVHHRRCTRDRLGVLPRLLGDKHPPGKQPLRMATNLVTDSYG